MRLHPAVGFDLTQIGDIRSQMRIPVLSLLIFLSLSSLVSADFRNIPLADAIEASGWVLRVSVAAVDEAAYDFSTKEAFTRVDLTVVEVLSGEMSQKTISLMLRGGLLPNGDYDVWGPVPELVVGETYVIMLRNGDYKITPFVTDVFREMRLSGQNVLADKDGFVMDLSGEFPVRLFRRFGATQVLRDQQREGRMGRASNEPPKQKGPEEALPATATQALSKIRELCAAKRSKEAAQKSRQKSARPVIQVRPSKFEPKFEGV